MNQGHGDVSLKGRVAMVTGAARGIGRVVAQTLARKGAHIGILDLNAKGATEAAKQLSHAASWSCDVRDRDAVETAVQQAHSELGGIDILVNCAGVWLHTPVLEVDETVWDEVFAVNVKGILFCSQAVAPGMIQRRSGKIINIASVAGFGGTSNWSAYCASKAAAISLTLSLADELRAHNVQVNAVCPGGTQTPMSDYIAQIEGPSNFSQLHMPEEVAGEVLKLVSPFDQSTTGLVVAMRPQDSVLGVPVRKPDAPSK